MTIAFWNTISFLWKGWCVFMRMLFLKSGFAISPKNPVQKRMCIRLKQRTECKTKHHFPSPTMFPFTDSISVFSNSSFLKMHTENVSLQEWKILGNCVKAINWKSHLWLTLHTKVWQYSIKKKAKKLWSAPGLQSLSSLPPPFWYQQLQHGSFFSQYINWEIQDREGYAGQKSQDNSWTYHRERALDHGNSSLSTHLLPFQSSNAPTCCLIHEH